MTAPPVVDLEPLPFSASDDAKAALASMGRTEDLVIAPDGRRLVIAAFGSGRIFFFDLDLDFSGGRRSIAISNPVEASSPDLVQPHGMAFIGDDMMIVSNRGARAPIFRIPLRGSLSRSVTLAAEPVEGGGDFYGFIDSPGSVAVVPAGNGRHEILLCNNYVNKVTRHRLDERSGLRISDHEVLLESGINVPDGVAVTRSRRWIAISSHHTHEVFMYRNAYGLNRHAPPDGMLHGSIYPHAVRFSANERFMLVADAKHPVANLYSAPGWRGWRGHRDPTRALRVIDEVAYERGKKVGYADGGPKGLDMDPGMNVFAITCEEVPLAFFDLPAEMKT